MINLEICPGETLSRWRHGEQYGRFRTIDYIRTGK